jgi:hypothetical protein
MGFDLTMLVVIGTDCIPSLHVIGYRTCLQKDNKPLSVILPGSQNAIFNFFFTWAGVSSKSILESSSDELILVPVNPGTVRIKTFNVE